MTGENEYDAFPHEERAPFGELTPDAAPREPRKYYFDGGQVAIATELVYELDADGRQLRVVSLSDYTAEKVRALCAGLDDLRSRWTDAVKRAEIIHRLTERGIDFETLATQAGKQDADPFDLLCHLAFNPDIS